MLGRKNSVKVLRWEKVCVKNIKKVGVVKVFWIRRELGDDIWRGRWG